MMLIIQRCCFIQSLLFSYELQEDFVQNSKQLVQFPCIRSDDVVFRPDAHLSSIIHPDDKNFSSGLPSVSRSFELFQVASVQKFQQHVQKPFSVSKTQIWEDSCNRLDNLAIPS
jgi:hypothetical protein